MAQTTRERFGSEMKALDAAVLQLGEAAQREVDQGLAALLYDDSALARQVIAEDENINRLRFAIESSCYDLIATEGPVAGDMRLIVAALSITTDLERIADHGKKIAKLSLHMAASSPLVPASDILRIGQVALVMLERALHAFATQDTAEAYVVCQADDDLDALYKQTFNVLLSRMLEDARTVSAGTYLIQAAHELERVGDRATNIAERVIYAVTGQLVELNL
jgi:phosphate transport system protein